MSEMDKKKKIKLIVLFAILILLGVISTTVAFFGWTAEEESTIDVTVIGGTGKCEFKSDNNIEIEPVTSRDSGRIVKFTAKQELAGETPIAWNMVINEIGGLQHETFRYEMINTTTGASYGSGNFANITNAVGSNTIYFSNDTEKLTYNTEYEFTLYLWIDGTIGNNPLSMANQNLDFDMNCVIDGTNGTSSVESPLQLGDYVSYTPTVTSYPTDTTKTGYSSSQTIYPNELNLWRVLNKNADGSVEIISEYVSSTDVYFQGQTGYLNYVGYLNTLAEQYETEGITSGSRYFGFNGQTEYLDSENVSFPDYAPWFSSTTDNSKETEGGGDILYEKDYNDVNTALGTRIAYRIGTTTATSYWMASRFYMYSDNEYQLGDTYSWDGRYMDTSGFNSSDYFSSLKYLSSSVHDYNGYNALRPIVTLKPGLEYTGQGTSGSPWQIVS